LDKVIILLWLLKGELFYMKINDIFIRGITCDSRKVEMGYAFVAINGEYYDGNEFIDIAIKNGAVIIYTERDIENKQVPVIKVDNARMKLSELLNIFYDYPSEKIKLIGVTGTNGKTSTTHIIEEIFQKAGYRTGLIGTVGIKYQHQLLAPSLTTPEPEVLYNILNKMVMDGVEVVIMEVSSHGLKFYRTHGLDFDVAIHTNIEKDHMNIHKTLEDYIETKKMLKKMVIKAVLMDLALRVRYRTEKIPCYVCTLQTFLAFLI